MLLIRRCLKVVLYGLLLLALLLAAAWWLARAQLEAMGIEQLEVSGMDMGWNRLAFESVNVTWSGDGHSVILQTLGTAMTLDWTDWQLDRLVARSARIEQFPTPGTTAAKPASGTEAFRLTLPDSMPFWLPRHLTVNNLEASFPCQGEPCRFKGALRFDRNDTSATAKVDASLARRSHTLTVRGDVQLGTGEEAIPGGDLVIRGLSPWLADLVSPRLQPLLPHSASLRFPPLETSAAAGQWPVSVTLSTEGGAAPRFQGDLVLHSGDNWRLDIARGRLTAALEQWQQAGWVLDDIRVDLPVSGQVTSDRSSLAFGPGARVRVAHMDPLATNDLMWLDRLTLSSEGLSLVQQGGSLNLEGPVRLDAGEIRHGSLVTQGWQLGADMQWNGTLNLDGELANDAGARMPLQVRYRPGTGVQGSATMTLSADNQANQLAKTLSAWPASLTMEEGEARLGAEFRWQPEHPLSAGATLALAGASGLYEQMAWQGLSGQVQANLANDTFTIEARALAMDELNPGMPLGPIRLGGSYEAAMAAPTAGTLVLANAQAGFAGGTLAVPPQTWRLDTLPVEIPVVVQGLQLSELMNLYPTEGLSGQGTLEGELPVIISHRGMRIDSGRLSALPPGGQLQLPADKLQGMAAANEAMALVTRAMGDFHYEMLESGISYSEDGTLVLDLQLRGSSPRVDSDRPVVLNINLQEDIPALLTSLQLSGRVNDAVTERVRERLQQDGVDTQ